MAMLTLPIENISFEREARYVAEHPEYERKTFSAMAGLKWIL